MCQQHIGVQPQALRHCEVWTLTLHHSNIHMFLCICNIRPPVTEMNLQLLQRLISALVSSHMGLGGLQHEPPPNSRARCENDVLQADVHMKVNSVTFSEFISSFNHLTIIQCPVWTIGSLSTAANHFSFVHSTRCSKKSHRILKYMLVLPNWRPHLLLSLSVGD